MGWWQFCNNGENFALLAKCGIIPPYLKKGDKNGTL